MEQKLIDIIDTRIASLPKELRYILIDLADYNYNKWSGKSHTVGYDVVHRTGFTTNQNLWIDRLLLAATDEVPTNSTPPTPGDTEYRNPYIGQNCPNCDGTGKVQPDSPFPQKLTLPENLFNGEPPESKQGEKDWKYISQECGGLVNKRYYRILKDEGDSDKYICSLESEGDVTRLLKALNKEPPEKQGDKEKKEPMIQEINRSCGNCFNHCPIPRICALCYDGCNWEKVPSESDIRLPEKQGDTKYDVVDFFIDHPFHSYSIETVTERLGRSVYDEILVLAEDGDLIKTDGGYTLGRYTVVTRLLSRLSEAMAGSVKSPTIDPGGGYFNGKCPKCGEEGWYYNHDEENECRFCGYVQNEYVGSGAPNSVEKRLQERYITILSTWDVLDPETVCNDLIMAHRRICSEVEELGEPKSVAVGAGHDAYCIIPHCGGVLRNYNGIYCYDCGQEYAPKSLIDDHGDEENNCPECDGTGRWFGKYCEACNATGIRFTEKQGEKDVSIKEKDPILRKKKED